MKTLCFVLGVLTIAIVISAARIVSSDDSQIVNPHKFNPGWSEQQKQLYVTLNLIQRVIPPSEQRDAVLRVLNDARYKGRTIDDELLNEMTFDAQGWKTIDSVVCKPNCIHDSIPAFPSETAGKWKLRIY